MNRRECLLSAASALTLASVPGARPALAKSGDEAAGPKFAPQVKHYVKIPMRDGTELSGSLYLPRGLKTPRPAIFAFGPYSADHYHPEGVSLSSYGYPFLSVDMRGRGDSGGEFSPFVTESKDAADIVDWIIEQPFCNGKVGSLGLSYYGYTQWGAVRGDARLATIVPSAPCFVGFDFPLRYNIFFNFASTFLTRVSGNTSRLIAYNDGQFWQTEFLRFLESGQPFRKMAEFFGLPAKPYEDWMEHPMQDEYWDRANPTPEQFANLTIPVLSMCGVYDGDQPGTLEFHRQHLKYAGAKANHYLVIGPWGHIEVRKPRAEYFGIKVGPDSVIDMPKLHRDWYAFAMEGGERPAFLKKKVAYYVMVADKWRYADTIEGVTARHEKLHLGSSGNADSVYNSGKLGAAPAGKPDHYVYDPRDLSMPKLETTLSQSHLLDQTMVLAKRRDQFVYHSEPFEQDVEVSGFFKLNAWIAIDQPDTDFIAQIYEIAPDGSSMFLTEQHMRARHREGLRTEKLIETAKPLRYDFENFFFVSRLVRKDHRLRLVFRANHGLAWQKNYNSGKPVADETMADARTVTVRLYHDAAHPSTLSIPIGQPDA
ncbi:CocE/NonD family hydrolase [Sphingosinicella rhizophila]|uniref:CocE/NonD family hydrolase n=1 Tax=Sphingosinicella rhizophila TaxID=3050082 RepID=A0ABU3Q4N8_9SPHN|nr:CocE/NonD family hydrolase [Sphingosinicella sp. GR2756]MDT9598381.1 CocE/NonD family hydrolase [Sphingosinicella sp. GR2756]